MLIDFLVSPAPHDRCLGDQGWYPISAILFAFQWELPERVEATSYTLNKVDTIVACSAVLFFKGGRVATFDCGVTSAHRSQFEIVCEKGTVRVDDLVKRDDVCLVKADVEGYEPQVLQTAQSLLSTRNVPSLQLE